MSKDVLRSGDVDAVGSVAPDAGMTRPPARERILTAAEQLFARHGFDGTATARIAGAAGVPKGLLFYYFPTKAAILQALLAERLDRVNLDPAVVAVPGDPVRTLMNVADTIQAAHEESDLLRVIVWHEQHVHPEARVALNTHRRALREAIGAVLAASLPPGSAHGGIRAAATAWESVINGRLVEDALERAADGLHAIAAMLCGGLLPVHAT